MNDETISIYSRKVTGMRCRISGKEDLRNSLSGMDGERGTSETGIRD